MSKDEGADEDGAAEEDEAAAAAGGVDLAAKISLIG